MNYLGAVRGRQAEETPFMHFGGQVFELLPSGAIYWHAERTLLVADLHLQKFSSYAHTFRALPPYDTGMTLARLAADLASTGAENVISLGDSFHRDEAAKSLLEADLQLLSSLLGQADWTWISGNHDPSPHALGGRCLPLVETRGMTLTHHPRRGAKAHICGHLHPAARVFLRGRSVRRPCFVHDGSTMILPAYGASTGSINILGPAFAGILSRPSLQVTMLGHDRVYAVSPSLLVNG